MYIQLKIQEKSKFQMVTNLKYIADDKVIYIEEVRIENMEVYNGIKDTINSDIGESSREEILRRSTKN